MKSQLAVSLMLAASFVALPAIAQGTGFGADPDTRADALVKQMTPAERIILLHGYWSRPDRTHKPLPPGSEPGAGYTPAIARLGIPALQESDASLGVSWIGGQRVKGGTALPSGLALAATWDSKLAYAGSAAIAQDARASGMNVLLAGGVDLTREPRNGRNFEYLGEDPLLAGVLVGDTIRGIQDQHVMATIKHFALNAQETARHDVSSDIGEAAARESDLLAFEIGIERGHPGAVMCAYNRYNGPHACESEFLLNTVLKKDWNYPGFVMSDWGAVYGTDFALKGLDRQSGEELDAKEWFGPPLAALDGKDAAYTARISDMNHRILRSMVATGLFDDPPKPGAIDVARGETAAKAEADEAIVLLKNKGVLPLAKTAHNIAVIGGWANAGVMSGGGSSQVQPARGPSATIPTSSDNGRPMMLHPSPPLAAIQAHAGKDAKIVYDDGRYIESAVAAASKADVVVLFATQWTTEGADAPNLDLPDNQDALIAAVTAANPHTIVVLETGGPVLMPWVDKAAAVLEAWYPGIKGGEAIADVLFGDVNPSGRLPITFPASLDQLPRPRLDGLYQDDISALHANYDIEGADVGYRWYDHKGLTPLFAFGHGLSYTSFRYDDLKVTGGDTLHVSFKVTNTGLVAGRDVPQVYVTDRAGHKGQRLIGWGGVQLAPGASQVMTVDADPRLLADWEGHGWRVPGGRYNVSVNASASAPLATGSAEIAARGLKP